MRTRRPRASRSCFPPTPGCCSSRSSRCSGVCSATSSGRSSSSPAGPRSRTSSACSCTSAAARTPCSSAGRWPRSSATRTRCRTRRCSRPTSSRPRRSSRTPRAASTPYDDVPDGLARARHRPRDARELRRRDPRRANRLLERPDGRLRVAALRRGHAGGRARRSPVRRLHGRRRRRLGAGAPGARARRSRLVGLDRRRRVARAPRGKRAPRRGGDPGSRRPGRRADHARRGELEDVQGRARGRPVRDADPPLARARRRGRRRRLPAVRLARGDAARASARAAAIAVFAQNVHWELEGAFTGEVSAPMLLELGVHGAIVGHSERRQLLRRDGRDRRLRAEAALEAGLHVIACVGETEAEREAGETEHGARAAGRACSRAHERLVIAYEPVWAIGTGTHGDAGDGAGGARVHQVAPSRPGALRRLGQAGQRRVAPLASRTSTARSSAARRSTSTSFEAICLAAAPTLAERAARRARHPRRLGACARRGRGTPSSSPTRRSSTRSGSAIRTRRSPPRARRSGSRRARWGTRRSGTSRSASGRILFQDLARVNQAVEDGSFFENDALVSAFRRARERGGDVHLLGLVSYGGVHSHIDHLRALLELAEREGMAERTWVHAFTDGRDVSPHAAARRPRGAPGRADRDGLRPLLRDGSRPALGEDRSRARRHPARARATQADDPVAAVRESYERGVTDEFVEPIVARGRPRLEPADDAAIFFNFRPDRARQLSQRLLEAGVDLTTMTRYREDFPFPVAFDEQSVANTLAEVLAASGAAPAPRRRDREVRARDVLLQRRRGARVGGRDPDPRALAARRRELRPEARDVGSRGRRSTLRRDRPAATASRS